MPRTASCTDMIPTGLQDRVHDRDVPGGEGGVKLALSLVSHGRVHCLYFTLVCLLFSSARYHPSPNVVQQCKFSALH